MNPLWTVIIPARSYEHAEALAHDIQDVMSESRGITLPIGVALTAPDRVFTMASSESSESYDGGHGSVLAEIEREIATHPGLPYMQGEPPEVNPCAPRVCDLQTAPQANSPWWQHLLTALLWGVVLGLGLLLLR